MPGLTSSQTVGPYFHLGLIRDGQSNLVRADTKGERIAIEGLVTDGPGTPVTDAMIEIWQANASGKYAHPADTQDKPIDPAFQGHGRVGTDQNGRFRFSTIKPGPVPAPQHAMQAPHLEISIFMRGLLDRLVSRIYFPGEAANADDPILKSVGPSRQETLIARKAKDRKSVV